MNPKSDALLIGGLLPAFVAALALSVGAPSFAQEQQPAPSCPQIEQDIGKKIGNLQTEWGSIKQKPPHQTKKEFQKFSTRLGELNVMAEELHRRMPACRLLPYQKKIEALADELIKYQESQPATPVPDNGIQFF